MSAPLGAPRRWPSLVLLGIVFLSGAVVGGGAASVYIARRWQAPDEQVDVLVADRLGAELDLSADERGRLKRSLSRRRERLRAIRDEASQREQAELDVLAEELERELRPDKARRLKQRIREVRQRLGRAPRGR